MKQIKIVGIGGSLTEHSSSLAALKIAVDGATESGAATQVFDIRTLDLPMYNPQLKDAGANVNELCEAVYQADGLLLSSPLYHGTISGSFKNALDWLELLSKRQPAYLTDKVVGLISTAGGTQGLQAVNTMEFIVRALRGWAVPLVMPISQAWKVFDQTGKSNDPKIDEQLRALGHEVARAAAQFARGAAAMTTADALQAETELQPLTDAEAGEV